MRRARRVRLTPPPPPTASARPAGGGRGARARRRRRRRIRRDGAGSVDRQAAVRVRSSAINLDKGDLMWSTPHGDTPDAVRNHPALKGVNIPKTGQSGNVGVVVTKTLVIAGDPSVTTTPEHPRGAMLRAYDKTDRQGSRRGVAAGAAERIADDLHASTARSTSSSASAAATTRASTSRSRCRRRRRGRRPDSGNYELRIWNLECARAQELRFPSLFFDCSV